MVITSRVCSTGSATANEPFGSIRKNTAAARPGANVIMAAQNPPYARLVNAHATAMSGVARASIGESRQIQVVTTAKTANRIATVNRWVSTAGNRGGAAAV